MADPAKLRQCTIGKNASIRLMPRMADPTILGQCAIGRPRVADPPMAILIHWMLASPPYQGETRVCSAYYRSICRTACRPGHGGAL